MTIEINIFLLIAIAVVILLLCCASLYGSIQNEIVDKANKGEVYFANEVPFVILTEKNYINGTAKYNGLVRRIKELENKVEDMERIEEKRR